MIEYELKDGAGNTFSLNGSGVTYELKRAFTQGGDDFQWDNRVIDRSFLPGASLIGEKRLKSKGFTLSFPVIEGQAETFRAQINELFFWANKTEYIVDVTNDMEIKVTADTGNISYDPGSLKRSSNNTIEFTALTPYWESLIPDSVSGTALIATIKEVAVNNEGFLEAYPIITLTAAIATDDIQIYINSDNTGIQVQDSSFGTAGHLTMIIDCAKGLVSINDDDRNVSIVSGTGFFPIPVGADTINILSNQEITYSIEWAKRVFI